MIITREQAIEKLNRDQVVGLPTETVYGLAGRVSRPMAIERIFTTKDRPSFDPLIIHIANLNQITSLVKDIPQCLPVIAEHFWPGPLTLVLEKSESVLDLITADKETVAIRMPQHPDTLNIIEVVGPVAAPSANPFGRTSPTSAKHVLEAFDNSVSVVDGGPCRVGIESTIIQVEESAQNVSLELLRPGDTSLEDILSALNIAGFKAQSLQSSHRTLAPGSLKDHYQPTSPLVLSEAIPWSESIHVDICAALSMGTQVKPTLWELSSRDPRLAARTLYADLRQNSPKDSYSYLHLPTPKNPTQYEAIMDRLHKACTLRVSLVAGERKILHK